MLLDAKRKMWCHICILHAFHTVFHILKKKIINIQYFCAHTCVYIHDMYVCMIDDSVNKKNTTQNGHSTPLLLHVCTFTILLSIDTCIHVRTTCIIITIITLTFTIHSTTHMKIN